VSNQILYSIVDQHIFGKRFGDVTALGLTDQEVYEKVIGDSLLLQQQHTLLPVASGLGADTLQNQLGVGVASSVGSAGGYPAMYLPSHTHFVTYGGGYYAYMYAKMAASHIWAENFAEDPFSRAGGLKLWDSMLRHGVSRPPRDMIRDMCGGSDVEPRHYFKAITG